MSRGGKVSLANGTPDRNSQVFENLYPWVRSDLDAQIMREQLKFAPQYSTSVKNYVKCGLKYAVCECEHCGTEVRTIHRCHLRYCSKENDVIYRIGRAKERLDCIGIKARRLYHFVIGSNDLNKKELELVIGKFFKKLRKSHQAAYIKVFDISKKHLAATGKMWLHYHIALLPEKIDVRGFISLCQCILNQADHRAVFQNIGWRTKDTVYSYFAKRMAGMYGHKKEGYYFLDDFLSMQHFFDIFYRSRSLTKSIPEGLACTIAPVSDPKVCPDCGSRMLFAYYELISEVEVLKPPD